MASTFRVRVLAILITLILPGCAAETELTLDPQTHQVIGKKTYKSHEEAWEALVERRIQAEIAGKPSDVRGETWPQFWRGWYASLRHNPDGEKRVAYIRAKRKEHGLDPY